MCASDLTDPWYAEMLPYESRLTATTKDSRETIPNPPISASQIRYIPRLTHRTKERKRMAELNSLHPRHHNHLSSRFCNEVPGAGAGAHDEILQTCAGQCDRLDPASCIAFQPCVWVCISNLRCREICFHEAFLERPLQNNDGNCRQPGELMWRIRL